MRKCLTVLIAMVVASGPAVAGEIEFTVKRLSPRALVLTERSPMENITVAIATQKGIVVVDALPSHEAASAARRIIEKELGRCDFVYVILTHGHWDHAFGNQVYGEAAVIAHAGAAESFRRDLARLDTTASAMEQRAIEAEGLAAGLTRYRALRAAGSGRTYLDEGEMNSLGYRLLGSGRTPEAIAVFTLNVEAFPASWNVHDSLGDAYTTAGRRAEAIASYRRSLELNPDNINGQEMLERLSTPPE